MKNSKFQIPNSKLIKVLIVLLLLIWGGLLFNLPVTRTQAATGACVTDVTKPRADKLISTGGGLGTSKFGNPGGQCVNDTTAIIAAPKLNSIDIGNYASLKNIFYTQSKLSKPSLPSNLAFTIDNIYNTSSLTISTGNSNIPSGNGTEVIFIDNDLQIRDNVAYHTNIGTTPPTGDSGGGLVFVVGGDVYIDRLVTRVDAIIIADGTIYTASTGGTVCSRNGVTASPLSINGSLISLNGSAANGAIIFCRTLNDNSLPSETINAQAKYAVILKDLMSRTVSLFLERPY